MLVSLDWKACVLTSCLTFMCVCVCVCVRAWVHVCFERERERERQTDIQTDRQKEMGPKRLGWTWLE